MCKGSYLIEIVETLNEVRITKALTQGLTIVIHLRVQDMEFLISWWSIENHMFIKSWGEFLRLSKMPLL